MVVVLDHGCLVAILPQELTLQRIRSRDTLRCVEDEACVLLSRAHLVGDTLLIEASVTRQIGLLGLHIAIQRALGQLLLVLVVLAVEARGYLAKVLGKGVLRLLHRVVVGAAAECPVGGELSGQSRSGVLVVAVDDALLRLVDHLAEERVLPGVLVCAYLRVLAKVRVVRRVDVVLAAKDLLQGVLLVLLAAKLTSRTLLSQPEGFVLVFGGGGYGLAAILLIWLIVDLLGLVEIVLIVVRQPLRQVDLGGRRRVLRL